MRWFSTALVPVLLCASCAVRTRTQAVSAPAVHEMDADEADEDGRPDAPIIGRQIADPAERRDWFEARRRTVAQLIASHARLGTPAATAPSTVVNPIQWTFIGPGPILNGTNSGNPLAGSVQNLALDARNPSTIYAGTYLGRLWKTTNAGTTWEPLSDAGPLLDVQWIAADPTLPNTVYVLNGGLIYQSGDGGATWKEVPVSPLGNSCSGESLAVHPAASGTWLISEYCGGSPPTSEIYKTTNSGTSWTKVATIAGEVNFVSFNAGTPSTVYMSGISPSQAVMFETSADTGTTWTSATGTGTTGLPQNLNVPGNTYAGFASALSDPKTVYLRVETYKGTILLQLYKTSDGGKTWALLNNYPTESPGARVPSLTAVDPKNPSLVYCGGAKIYLSTDGGNSWADVRGDLGTGGMHGDNHSMIFTPDGNTLYASNDGGVWSSTNFRSTAVAWVNLNATLGNTEFSGQLGMDPTNPNRTFGGLQDNFSIEYTGSTEWSIVHASGDGRGSAVNPQNPNIVYEMEGSELYESTTGGSSGTWKGPIVSVPGGARFYLDYKTPQNLYIESGPGSDFMQTTDGGKTWNQFGPPNANNINWVAIAPSDSSTVMVLDSSMPWITNDGGGTWNAGLPGSLAAMIGSPQQIVIDTFNSKKVYMLGGRLNGTAAPLMVSLDGGMSWQARDLGPNITDTPRRLVIDPDLANVLYLGTATAVFRSSDGGTTWNPLASNFPMSQITDMALHRSARVLRVATAGRGAWDLSVPLSAPLLSSALLKISGSGYAVTVNGSNFTSNSQIWLNGHVLATTFASPKQLTAPVSASSVTPSTVYSVAVSTPGNAGGLSDPVIGSSGPTIYPGGILNAAGPVSAVADAPGDLFDVRLSPGMFATIYGSELAAAISQAAANPFPKTLGNVSVLVNGSPAPLYYVSPNQIDFVLPWSTASGTAAIQVVNGSAASNSVSLQVEAAPQIFTTNQQGFGQAAVLVAGTSTIAAPADVFPGSRPAVKGEYLSIYATGLGAVATPPADGAPASGADASIVPLSVNIGCRGNSGALGFCQVAPQYSGLAPGFVGLYQVNFQVPATALSGNQVPIQLIPNQSGERPSNIVTIAIK